MISIVLLITDHTINQKYSTNSTLQYKIILRPPLQWVNTAA